LALAGCGTTSAANQSVTVTGNDLTVYISAPTGYQQRPELADTVAAEQLAYQQHASEVTGFALHLRLITAAKLSDNARKAISDTHAIAYLGELQPGASDGTVGITNAQDLLQVSPTDTALELTRRTPAIPSAPKHYYESTSSYGRTFARVVPNAAVEARAQVQEMRKLGVSTLYVTDDGSDYGRALAAAVRQDASGAGLKLAGSDATSDATFYGGTSAAGAARVFMGAAGSNPQARLFASSGLATTEFATAIGSTLGSTKSSPKVYVSLPAEPAAQLPAAAAQFVTDFKSRFGHAPAPQAIYGYEAMAAVIDAIHKAGRGANDRARVVRDFDDIRNRPNSLLGPYSITAGDSSLTGFVFETPKAGRLVRAKA
jgi:ABC-type branched-subunit amino acid transport system substrate-binding protein